MHNIGLQGDDDDDNDGIQSNVSMAECRQMSNRPPENNPMAGRARVLIDTLMAAFTQRAARDAGHATSPQSGPPPLTTPASDPPLVLQFLSLQSFLLLDH